MDATLQTTETRLKRQHRLIVELRRKDRERREEVERLRNYRDAALEELDLRDTEIRRLQAELRETIGQLREDRAALERHRDSLIHTVGLLRSNLEARTEERDRARQTAEAFRVDRDAALDERDELRERYEAAREHIRAMRGGRGAKLTYTEGVLRDLLTYIQEDA